MIKAIFFDAGGVLFLNKDGVGVINDSIMKFIGDSGAQYIFGILSSTDLPLRQIASSYKVDDYFRIIQTSGESHLKKDSPEFFTSAVDKLQIQPSESIMVDNDDDFLEAAQNAGLLTIKYTKDTNLTDEVAHLS
jgi:FMN phosphatase YigB (HAD superfamily)